MDWLSIFERVTRLVFETETLCYVRETLPPHVVAERKLTTQGASKEQLHSMEERLGIALPSSYRDFLLASNGVRYFPWLGSLCSIEETGWFRDLDAEWCQILEEAVEDWKGIPRSTSYPNDDWPGPFARDLLQVSLGLDDNTVLLNPKMISADGEWEAYSFFSHGSQCFRSFGELIVASLDFAEIYCREHPEDPRSQRR